MCNSEQFTCSACGKRFTLWFDTKPQYDVLDVWCDPRKPSSPLCDTCAKPFFEDAELERA